MLDSLISIVNILLNIFNKLPQKKKDEIINTITESFKNIFKKKNRNAESMKAAAESVMNEEWRISSSFAISSLMPVTFPKRQKEKFTESLVELVRSDTFMIELEKRLQKYNDLNEEEYIEASSIEMKKLVKEMLK